MESQVDGEAFLSVCLVLISLGGFAREEVSAIVLRRFAMSPGESAQPCLPLGSCFISNLGKGTALT